MPAMPFCGSSRPFRPFGAVLLTVAVAGGSLCAARGRAVAEDLDVRITPQGDVVLVDAGTIKASLAVETPALRRGTPHAERLAVAGRPIWQMRLPIRGTEAEEVWVGEASAGTSGGGWSTLWHGLDGPRDTDAEAAVHVTVDGRAIWRFQTTPAVSRCDDPEPRLFPEAWDFQSGRFRSTLSPLPPPAPTTLTAVLGAKDMPLGAPRGGFRWVAASTTLGAGTDARNLLPPHELDDGDPKSAWSEGLGGDGRGEFVTARARGGAVAVKGLRILVAHAQEPRELRQQNRVRRLQLILGRPEGPRRFDVVLPTDRDPKGALPPYWVSLPEAVETDCVSLVLTDVAAPGGAGTTGLAGAEIFTDLDGADAPERLVARLTASASCAAGVAQVTAEGEAALPALAAALSTTRGPSRGCLLEALAGIPGRWRLPAAKDGLLASILGATADEERWLARAFEGQDAEVLPALVAVLRREDAAADDRARAARLLGGLGSADSRAALLDAAGLGDEQVRNAVVAAAAASASLTGDEIARAYHAEGRSLRARADLLRVLAPWLDRAGPVPEAASWLSDLGAAARAPGDEEGRFELRARALAALGHLVAPGSSTVLSSILAEEGDEVLRYFAARELVHKGPSEGASLRRALGDADPRVRETAADGLALFHDRSAADGLVAAAKDEGWPFARRAEIGALARLCVPSTFYLLERAVERDSEEVARAGLEGLAHCQQDGADELLWKKLRDPQAKPGLRELAAALIGSGQGPRAAQNARSLALEMPRLLEEARQAERASVAEAGLRSLSSLGGPDASRVLREVASDPKSGFRGVAIEGLGHLCDAESLALLRSLVSRAGDAGAEPAARSLKRCDEKGRP